MFRNSMDGGYRKEILKKKEDKLSNEGVCFNDWKGWGGLEFLFLVLVTLKRAGPLYIRGISIPSENRPANRKEDSR